MKRTYRIDIYAAPALSDRPKGYRVGARQIEFVDARSILTALLKGFIPAYRNFRLATARPIAGVSVEVTTP
jgi:hypothetical protein